VDITARRLAGAVVALPSAGTRLPRTLTWAIKLVLGGARQCP